MSYYRRLSDNARLLRRQDPDDGRGVLVCGLAIIAVAAVVAMLWWAIA